MPAHHHAPSARSRPQRFGRLFATLLGAVLLGGCARIDIKGYAAAQPVFDPFVFFAGQVHAWGLVQDWRGRVTRRFDVSIIGHQEGDIMVLDEAFRYDDGETDTRTWRIARSGNGAYSGIADDIVGSAHGETAGNTMHWTYDLDLVVDGSTWRVGFDDWMWQLDEGTLMNRSAIRKFGLTVGEVTLFMQRKSVAP